MDSEKPGQSKKVVLLVWGKGPLPNPSGHSLVLFQPEKPAPARSANLTPPPLMQIKPLGVANHLE